MITTFDQIEKLFVDLDKLLTRKVNIYVIGGAVMLHANLKPVTKDVDIIVDTNDEFKALNKALKDSGFEGKIPTLDYTNMDLNQILIKDDFRIDLFQRNVCRGFSLSAGMIKRATNILNTQNISLNLCSHEDILLFKCMTEREGDIQDSFALGRRNLNWTVILEELQLQIEKSKQKVWITWVAERLEILEERGLNIPIMKTVSKLRAKYFNELDKSIKSKKIQ